MCDQALKVIANAFSKSYLMLLKIILGNVHANAYAFCTKQIKKIIALISTLERMRFVKTQMHRSHRVVAFPSSIKNEIKFISFPQKKL